MSWNLASSTRWWFQTWFSSVHPMCDRTLTTFRSQTTSRGLSHTKLGELAAARKTMYQLRCKNHSDMGISMPTTVIPSKNQDWIDWYAVIYVLDVPCSIEPHFPPEIRIWSRGQIPCFPDIAGGYQRAPLCGSCGRWLWWYRVSGSQGVRGWWDENVDFRN